MPNLRVTIRNFFIAVCLGLGWRSLHTSAVIAFARTCWNHEKSKNMYKAHELFIAISIFELPMGMFMAVLVYLVRPPRTVQR